MINNEVFQSFAMGAAATVPIIVAITQAFKFWINEKFAPFVSIIVGIGINMLLTHDFIADLSGTILLGILYGLASSGLYSGIKTTAQAIKMQKQEEQAKKESNKCK